jgi:hypothetical protein
MDYIVHCSHANNVAYPTVQMARQHVEATPVPALVTHFGEIVASYTPGGGWMPTVVFSPEPLDVVGLAEVLHLIGVSERVING